MPKKSQMTHLNKCLILSILGAVLFFALSPGVLLTFTVGKKSEKCKGNSFLALRHDKDNCSTSYAAAGVAAVVFGILLFLVCLSLKLK
jgi:hypothetical protein